jgi:hypothetical protein
MLDPSRIHGELLKLGIYVEQISVAKYWQGIENPSQGWKTFLRNHTDGIYSHLSLDMRLLVQNEIQ